MGDRRLPPPARNATRRAGAAVRLSVWAEREHHRIEPGAGPPVRLPVLCFVLRGNECPRRRFVPAPPNPDLVVVRDAPAARVRGGSSQSLTKRQERLGARSLEPPRDRREAELGQQPLESGEG